MTEEEPQTLKQLAVRLQERWSQRVHSFERCRRAEMQELKAALSYRRILATQER